MEDGKVIPEFDGHRIIWHECSEPDEIYREEEEKKQAYNVQRSSVSGGVAGERGEGVSYYDNRIPNRLIGNPFPHFFFCNDPIGGYLTATGKAIHFRELGKSLEARERYFNSALLISR